MRTNDHDTTEALHYTTANRNAWNAHVGTLVVPERLMREAMTSDLSVTAAQLIEAACRVPDGCDLLIKCLRTGAVHGLRMAAALDSACVGMQLLLGLIQRIRYLTQLATTDKAIYEVSAAEW